MQQITLLMLVFLAQTGVSAGESKTAVLSGGCFWCMEAAFQELKGVHDVVSGFTGGVVDNPTYDGNHDGHYEAVRISYDPNIISYQVILDHFWVNIDPFDRRGQFCDKGLSYRSAIFVENESERRLAEASMRAVAKRFPELEVVTPILKRKRFYPVDEYHQDYYIKNPISYRYYRAGCRRDQRLKQIWGKDGALDLNADRREDADDSSWLSNALRRLFGSG